MKRTRENIEVLQVQLDALRQARLKSAEGYDREIHSLELRLRNAGGTVRSGLSPASGQPDYLENNDMARTARENRSKRTHTMSPAARLRIAVAQKKRWAAHKQAQKAAIDPKASHKPPVVDKLARNRAKKAPAAKLAQTALQAPGANQASDVEAALTEFTA